MTKSFSIICAAALGVLVALPVWAQACGPIRIDMAGSDRVQNKAACGKDVSATRLGTLVLAPGGFVELYTSSDGARLRCDGPADKSFTLQLHEGQDWHGRVSAAGCQWQGEKLMCGTTPACTVEVLQRVRQRVAVYATVQLRTAEETSRVDSTRIRDWLAPRRGVFEHCRQLASAELPVELDLHLSRDGKLTIDTPTKVDWAPVAACLTRHLAPQAAPAGLGDDYSLHWRLEAP